MKKHQQLKKKVEETIKLISAGKEPNYKDIATHFKKHTKIKKIDSNDTIAYNKYYKDWVGFMKQYYPELAMYPAYIWRGWGYMTNQNNNDQNNDNSMTQNEQPDQSTDIDDSSNDEDTSDGGDSSE